MPIELRNDGRIMDSNFIASNILKKLGKDRTTPSKHFRSMMKSKYDGHKPSYFKVWDAKQKAIGKIFGNWEESYQRLQKLLLAYVHQDLDTRVFYHTIPTSVDDTRFLHYICFGLSVYALMDSNITSRLSKLIGPICMVNIKESC